MKSLPCRTGRGGEVVNQHGDVVNQHGDQLRDPMARRETSELVRTYYTIEKPVVRKRVLEMVKSIATKLSDE